MVLNAIKNSFEQMDKRGWDKVFYFVDLHSTVVKPNFSTKDIPKDFYEGAKEALQYLTEREDVCLIMYTCSHKHEIVKYIEYFKEHGIIFNYVNENPEVKTDLGGYGCYDDKPYMNVMIDDKAGFDAETEWITIMDYFKTK